MKSITITEQTTIETVSGEVVDTAFSTEERKGYKALCRNFQSEIGKVEKAYFNIAKIIFSIYQKKLYKIDGFINIYDMVLEKFSLSRASCNTYLNICKRFGIISADTGECTGLLPEYEPYSSSQLVAMLPMPDKLLNEVKSEMSVRSIKDIWKCYKEKQGIPAQEEVPETITPADGKSPKTKRKKVELLKAADIAEVKKTGNTTLMEKLEAFETEHPDASYRVSIILVYEE